MLYRDINEMQHSDAMPAKLLQSYPTLSNTMGCSPPGSSVRGIFQARLPEWVAISFSGGIFPTQGSNPHLLLGRQTLYH